MTLIPPMLAVPRRPDPYHVLADYSLDSVDRTTYTFSSVSLGTPRADRKILLVSTALDSTTKTGITATLDGSSGTVLYTQSGASNWTADFRWFSKPTGTTGTIVVTNSGTVDMCAFVAYAVYGSWTPSGWFGEWLGPLTLETTDTDTISYGDSSGYLVICTHLSYETVTATWSGTAGLIEDIDYENGNDSFHVASRWFPSGTTTNGKTVTITCSGSGYVVRRASGIVG